MNPNVVPCFSVLGLVLVLPLPLKILLLIKPLPIVIWVLLSLLTCPGPITFLKCVHRHIILSTLSEGMSLLNLHLLLQFSSLSMFHLCSQNSCIAVSSGVPAVLRTSLVWRQFRGATRFMVPLSHCLDYKGRLTALQLLPLMYYYDLQDLLFLIKCLLSPPDNFNILQYISFSSHGTRSTTAGKLKVNYRRTSTTWHFYFNRVVTLWNAVPPSCLDLTFTYNTIRRRLLLHFWDHFLSHFSSDSPCSSVHAPHVTFNDHISSIYLSSILICSTDIIFLFWLQHLL